MNSDALIIVLMELIAFIAWDLMTFAPIAMAFGSWALATRIQNGWIVHVLFVPALLGVEWLLVGLMFWGARDDGEGPPGLGLAMIPAIVILGATVVIYYGALGFRGAAAVMRRIAAARGRPIH